MDHIGEALTVTASLGVVVFSNDGTDIKTLLKPADIALYRAKEAGRDIELVLQALTQVVKQIRAWLDAEGPLCRLRSTSRPCNLIGPISRRRSRACAFVRNLEGEGAKTPIINAVLDLAKRLRLTTVAEGVETAAKAQLLKSRGCDFAQGYFYSKPEAARQCLKMLQELERERLLTETLLVRAIAID